MAQQQDVTVPAGACDCHMHVFGTVEQYPPAPVRGYTPRPATFEAYRTMAATLGLERVVLVQPSAYGTDNRCMTDTLGAGDPSVRGVAVIDAATSDVDLDACNAIGVRGVRLNLVSSGEPDPNFAATQLRTTAARVARLGWHIQIFAEPHLLAHLWPVLPDLPVPVVIDHMGGVKADAGADQPGVVALAGLLRREQVWVKVSGANRVSRQPTGFDDALPIMRALIAANPARLVWGTDWPHIGAHTPGQHDLVTYMAHDNAGLLNLLGTACDGDAATLKAILTDNAARLYGFGI